ncbi:Cpe/LpqF family protein [Jiangella asiatica]|uniref:Serine hydrolase n=1 Tax=Jiangella asiatica TaxID=2530372 RepID=A0A4R5C990_9ACTN|nr:Cpe/LpqF family protein [Jiangella asiatica]TDD96378.1 serine hydrolase [Jiangella asiatica]
MRVRGAGRMRDSLAPAPRERVRAVALTVAVAAVVAGCTGDDDPAAPSPTPSAPSATLGTEGTATVAPPVELPDTPVGRQARWVLDQLAADGGPTVAEAGRRFNTEFLAEVRAEQVSTVFDELRPAGPWVPVDVDEAGADAVVRLHDGDGQPWRMIISVDDDGVIGTLLFQPDRGGETQAARSWAEVQERLTAFDADVGLFAARVGDDGRCEPVAAIDPGRPRPMASIFKLYVLGAVAAAVDAGEVRWDDPLTVTGDNRSLPSGELQNQPDGARVSVAQAAAGMIAISDNTASELLTDLVGRAAVEAAMADMGHDDPATNVPFLTTREFFTVGWGPQDLRDDWDGADAERRGDILETLPDGPLTVAGRDVDDPAWGSGVDWFASAEDICDALVSLHDGEGADADPADAELLRTVLGHNRGVTIDEADWPYVAYKGGSAPGVVTGSWYGERADGERYVYVMQAAAENAGSLADHTSFFALAEDAFRLFAED